MSLTVLNQKDRSPAGPASDEVRHTGESWLTTRFDKVEEPRLPGPLAWLRSVQDRLGPDRQLWAALALSWASAGLLAFALSRPGRWRAAYGWGVAALLLAVSISVGSWYMTWTRLAGTPQAVVLQPSAEVRAGPGLSNPTLFTVHEGLTIEVRDVRDDWVQVGLPNGYNGWIPRAAIEIV